MYKATSGTLGQEKNRVNNGGQAAPVFPGKRLNPMKFFNKNLTVEQAQEIFEEWFNSKPQNRPDIPLFLDLIALAFQRGYETGYRERMEGI
jgi:hypothetical protein